MVGNGVIGLSIAFELSRRAPDLRIVVIGPPDRPMAASAAAGAMLNCFGEVTPFTSHHPPSAAKFAIARAALDTWPAWLDALSDTADGTRARRSLRPGTFVVLPSTAGTGTAAHFHAIEAALRECAEPFDEVTPDAVEGLRPADHARPARILYLRREGSIDAREVLALLEQAVRVNGVDIVPATVHELDTAGSRVRGVRLAGGESIAAPNVVLAAGSLAQDFLKQLPAGSIPPLLPSTGLAVQTHRKEFPGFTHVVRTPNAVGGCGTHLVPLAEHGHEYIGATNTLHFQPSSGPNVGVTVSLLKDACEQFDHRIGLSQVTHWPTGRRPVALDGFPLIGPVFSCTGLVLATGTYRDGFHSSPVIARHITDVLLNGDAKDPHFGRFAVERLPIQRTTVEESVDAFVRHEVDASVASGLRLPYFLEPDTLTLRHRELAERIYAQLSDPIALIPEVLDALAYRPDDGAHWLDEYLQAARRHHGTPPSTGGHAESTEPVSLIGDR
ncbi:FAD-binding oxidoreductase [Actinosynnema sp. NPDC050436]|uniref:NAD(P)/FAD-dependent oxidoreductase n=1 Tax=Actinosynnema sp. NPDC050436 TaxID=3155659 RepID=UPI0033C97863